MVTKPKVRKTIVQTPSRKPVGGKAGGAGKAGKAPASNTTAAGGSRRKSGGGGAKGTFYDDFQLTPPLSKIPIDSVSMLILNSSSSSWRSCSYTLTGPPPLAPRNKSSTRDSKVPKDHRLIAPKIAIRTTGTSPVPRFLSTHPLPSLASLTLPPGP